MLKLLALRSFCDDVFRIECEDEGRSWSLPEGVLVRVGAVDDDVDTGASMGLEEDAPATLGGRSASGREAGAATSMAVDKARVADVLPPLPAPTRTAGSA